MTDNATTVPYQLPDRDSAAGSTTSLPRCRPLLGRCATRRMTSTPSAVWDRIGSERPYPTGRSRTQPDPTGNDPCASSLVRGQSGNGGRRLDRPLPSLGGRFGYEIKKINLPNGLVNTC